MLTADSPPPTPRQIAIGWLCGQSRDGWRTRECRLRLRIAGEGGPTVDRSSEGVTAAEDNGDGGPTAAGNDDSPAYDSRQGIVDGDKQQPTIDGSAGAGKRQSHMTTQRGWEG